MSKETATAIFQQRLNDRYLATGDEYDLLHVYTRNGEWYAQIMDMYTGLVRRIAINPPA